jgi:hypothetical protein
MDDGGAGKEWREYGKRNKHQIQLPSDLGHAPMSCPKMLYSGIFNQKTFSFLSIMGFVLLCELDWTERMDGASDQFFSICNSI